MNYTRPITANLLSAGLAGTLGYTVVSAAGATLIVRTTAGITEDGSTAIYKAAVANWDASWTGWITWDAGSGTLAREEFQAVLVAPTGLNAVPGWSDWNFPQTLQAVAQLVQGPRSGVVRGVAGTATFTDNNDVDYGTVTYDVNGNVTSSNMSPP